MKKLLLLAITAFMLSTTSFAQEKEEKVVIKKNKKLPKKKVIISDEKTDANEEEVTVTVDNDNTKNVKKKVKVFINGENIEATNNKEKKVTVIVDGDKVTVNGKPVEDMNDEEIKVFKGNKEHLRLIAPYMRNNRRFNLQAPPPPPTPPNFNDEIQMDFNIKPNKALLGVITEKDEKGAKINNVSKGSAAEKAGLQQDDIITKVDEITVKNTSDLVDAIAKYEADDKVKITFLRNGNEQTVEATLTKNKAISPKVFMFNNEDMPMQNFSPNEGNKMFEYFYQTPKPKLGLKVQDIEDEKGAKILEIETETPTAKAGLQKDDIITKINEVVVNSVDELKEQLRDAQPGDVYKIQFKRNGNVQTTEIKFPKKLKTADL